MNLAEFVQRYHEGDFEWVRGEEVELQDLPLALEKILERLTASLRDYTKATGGEVFVHTPFVLLNAAEEVQDARTPNAMIYLSERTQSDHSGVLLSVPNLVIEIIYQAEEIPEMYRKTLAYLKMGVEQVWLIDPDMSTLSIYRQDTKEITVLGTRHKLMNNPLFPGLEVDIVNLFG
ncbi:MAG: Uma2 family endonuclease [Anaerolineae bacterium]